MQPGLYVARTPRRSRSNRVMIESIAFQRQPGDPGEALRDVTNWCEFIQSQHPKDEVFVIEVGVS